MYPEQFSTAFLAWERPGRGYAIWPKPVELEPLYRAFGLTATLPAVVDDGRRPSLWQSLFGREENALAVPAVAINSEAAAPYPYVPTDDQLELQLVLPEGFVVRPSFAEQFLASFYQLRGPFSFELIGLPEGIVVQVTAQPRDFDVVRQNLSAYFPEARIKEKKQFLQRQWRSNGRWGTLIDFGLSEAFFRPLESGLRVDVDPLISVIAALDELQRGELGLVQVLFQPALQPWELDLLNALSLAADAEIALPLARRKVSEPLFATVLRVVGMGADSERAFQVARNIGNALITASRSQYNELIPVDNQGYDLDDHAEDILKRQSRRSGMLLNLSELLSLAHPPSATVRAPRLRRISSKTKPPPAIARDKNLILGRNEHDEEEVSVGLSDEQRLRHVYVVGASGTGKSKLLLNMIMQDMDAGRGIAVLDPHGDLIDEVLARVPNERVKDVILFDPADREFPIGFNILAARSESEKTLLASDLVAVFQRLATSWGDQMTSILGNAILALLESREGGTLIDLRRFLIEDAFRDDVLATVQDRDVVYFWKKEFPLLRKNSFAPLLTRLDTFLRQKLVRYMVAQKSDTLDFKAMMDDRRIFLGKLAQGAIGEENSYLLGSLLVSRFHQSAMARQETPTSKRQPFFLYIDEFHHFITPSMAALLSGVRKFGLGLTLAHQDLRQISSRNADVESAILANAYTRVVFRVNEQDARTLAAGFAFFEADDLTSLGSRQAIARVERADFDFNLKTLAVKEVDPSVAAELNAHLVANSRARYATPREQIEAMLQKAAEDHQDAPGSSLGSNDSDPGTAVDDAGSPRELRKRRPPRRPQPVTRSKISIKPKPSAVRQPQVRADRRTKEQSHQEERRSSPEEAALYGSLPGRGGSQHKYLQSLVKRLAEDRGFDVYIEKMVLDGHGHVDVALEREGVSIACEISVTTRVAHEIANLTKGLAAGYDYAVLISSDIRALDAADELLTDTDEDRIRLLTPDALIAFLDQIRALGRASEDRRPRRNVGGDASSSKASDAQSPRDTQRLFIAKDAAAYIGLATQTLAKLRVTGGSPPYFKVGRQVLYDKAELDTWLAQRRRKSTSDAGSR